MYVYKLGRVKMPLKCSTGLIKIGSSITKFSNVSTGNIAVGIVSR